MKTSIIDWFNRAVYICCGVLLGLQIFPFLQSSDVPSDKTLAVQKTPSEMEVLERSYNFSKNIEVEESIEVKEFIESVIRDEIRKQLSGHVSDILSEVRMSKNDLPKNKQNQTALSPEQASESSQHKANTNSKDLMSEASEEQLRSYQAAEQLISDAIASNQWDKGIARQLVSHLNQLTVKQELAIRTQYANAINEGWIVSDMPLDLVEVQ